MPRGKWKHAETSWTYEDLKPIGHSRSSSKVEIDSNKTLPQEARKISNIQWNLTHKTTRCSVTQLCPTVCNPMNYGTICPWNFPGKNTGVGCHFHSIEELDKKE